MLTFLFAREAEDGPILADVLRPSRVQRWASAFVVGFVYVHFCVIVLGMPATAAGPITEEKVRGNLQNLLTTALRPGQILLGRLLAQMLLYVNLVLTGFPLFCLFAVLAGFSASAILVVLLLTALWLLGLGSAGVLASVWGRTTTSAVLAVYAVGALAVFALWRNGLIAAFHPFALMMAITESSSGDWLRLLLPSVAFWCGLTIICLALASWRLRPAFMHQLDKQVRWRRLRRWLSRPAVTNTPLRWKECFVGELATLPWLKRTPRGLLVGVVVLATVFVSGGILLAHLPAPVRLTDLVQGVVTLDFDNLAEIHALRVPADTSFFLQGLIVAFVVALVVATRSAGAISGERERHTWDLLLVSPLEPRHIVRGKLWGIIDSGRPYLLAYLIPAGLLAMFDGFLSLFWIIFWWLVLWILTYFMGATGIACSLRFNNSWRSGRATLASNIWIVTVRYLLIGAMAGAVTAAALTALTFQSLPVVVVAAAGVVVSCVVTALLLLAEAEIRLVEAERRLAVDERLGQGEQLAAK